MEEFDIEKVESLNFETLDKQLKYIFSTEQDIVNFINFLKNIKKFVSLSNDKRHSIQMELSFFKTQIQLFKSKLQVLIDKKRNEQVKASIKRAKGSGEKITENIIEYYKEDITGLDTLIEMYNITTAWDTYMNDLYYVCNQTNKNLGNFG